MAGIQSLMSQGPVPGQAPQQPMSGMMPKPGASTPPAQVKFLETKPSKELRAMYNQEPSLALLTAYTKAVEREELDASMRGQRAIQQAAGAPDTLADAIMSRPVMAAHGGIMQGYAGGGAVAFGGGGAVQHFKDGADENGVQSFMERLPKDSGARRLYEWIKAGRPSLEKPILDALLQKEQQVAAPTAEGAPAAALTTAPQMTPQQRERFSPPAAAAAPPGAADRTGPGPGPGPGAGNRPVVAAATPADTGLPTDTPIDMSAYRQRLENLASEMRTGSRPSEAVLASRQGLAALAAQNLAEQRKEARDAEAAAKAELERRLQYTRSSPFTDAQSLFRIAAAIDPRRGKSIGSLSSGIAGEMEKRTAAGEEAQKAFATSQEGARQRNALIRQAQFLEATRAHAEAVGDDATERQARQQLATLYTELEKFNVDVQQKNKDQAIARYNAQSQRMGAQAQMKSAGKPTAQEFNYALFKADPEKYKAFLAAGQEPKSEGAMLKEIVSAAMKNPLMLQQYPPAIQALVNQELLKLGVTSALPQGTPVRE